MNTARRIYNKVNIYQDKRDKVKVFVEQYKKANVEVKSKKSEKYTILRRRDSDSDYKSNKDLEVFRRQKHSNDIDCLDNLTAMAWGVTGE